jgi:hypothetical protein
MTDEKRAQLDPPRPLPPPPLFDLYPAEGLTSNSVGTCTASLRTLRYLRSNPPGYSVARCPSEVSDKARAHADIALLSLQMYMESKAYSAFTWVDKTEVPLRI